jgi:hypothetical protein
MILMDIGEKTRRWLTEKLGNPLMTSKEKRAIRELEESERVRYESQERGDDPDEYKPADKRSMGKSN